MTDALADLYFAPTEQSKENLLKEVAEQGFAATGRKYGVSDKSIAKWCKAYGLPTKIKDIKELYSDKV